MAIFPSTRVGIYIQASYFLLLIQHCIDLADSHQPQTRQNKLHHPWPGVSTLYIGTRLRAEKLPRDRRAAICSSPRSGPCMSRHRGTKVTNWYSIAHAHMYRLSANLLIAISKN